MGNTQPSVEIAQANCPLIKLVEDVFVIVLRNIQLRDFISLMSTCKLFYYHRLGSNNYFWAQFCAQVTGSINNLLLYVQQGRRFIMNGETINLSKPILPTDKTLISQFNFRSELEKYYILIYNLQRITPYFTLKPPFAYLAPPTVTVNSASSRLPRPWTNLNKSRQQYAQDYYYLVDFGGNPGMVMQHLVNPNLPDQIGGREIVYANSVNRPPIYNPTQISRMGPSMMNYPPIQARSLVPPRPQPQPTSTNFDPKPWNGRFHPYDAKNNGKKRK